MEEIEQVLASLQAALRSSVSAEREKAAEEVTDVHKSFSALQLKTIVSSLVDARLLESDDDCQEAQLNALADIKEWHNLASSAFAKLTRLDAGCLQGSQAEYMKCLLE